MPFITKLDFSNNRQAKQDPRTITVLSGATSFGVPFSALTSGPNLLTTGITETYNNVVSTFSGNSGTTNYSWYDSRMSLAESTLSALTPSNSATTQNTGQVYTANTTTVIDGNTVALDYSGVSYNISVTGMTDLGGGNYSGSVLTNTLSILSADTLDFTGRTIWVDVSGITRTDRLMVMTVGSSPFVNDIRIDANGNLTTNTSDLAFKENVNEISNALKKILDLKGVTYQWKDRTAGGDDIRFGFIAQEVEKVEPNLVFTNKVDNYKGIHIDGIISLLVEAVKEIINSGVRINGVTTSGNTYLETQTILAEDNNIDLNYGGTKESAIGGGISIINAISDGVSAQILTDKDGNWVTNNDFKPSMLTIPKYTPTSCSDKNGTDGNITRDDNYLYVKVNNIWKRTNLQSF